MLKRSNVYAVVMLNGYCVRLNISVTLPVKAQVDKVVNMENTQQRNTRRHNEALKVAADFEAKGGKIRRFDIQIGREDFKAIKPKRLININDQVKVT